MGDGIPLSLPYSTCEDLLSHLLVRNDIWTEYREQQPLRGLAWVLPLNLIPLKTPVAAFCLTMFVKAVTMFVGPVQVRTFIIRK